MTGATGLRVVFTRRASREAERIEAWWRENRPSAPEMFVTDLQRMVTVISTAPSFGVIARSDRISGLRRALLERTRYHLYFRAIDDRIEILAIWHASRGRPPRL